MIVLVTKYRLTGWVLFYRRFSSHFLNQARHQVWQLEGTADPQIGAATERRQFKWQYHRIPTGSREEAGSECFGTFGTFHQFYAAKNITISTNCNRHHQFKWQYHPIPTSDDFFSEEKICSAFWRIFSKHCPKSANKSPLKSGSGANSSGNTTGCQHMDFAQNVAEIFSTKCWR